MPAPVVPPFQQQVSYKSITFRVASPASATSNSFTLTPSGYTKANDAVTQKIEGVVVDVKVADIDRDGSPEVAVIAESGPTKIRQAYVYSSNGTKSLSQVSLLEPDPAPDASNGYRGGDEFEFVESTLVRRFPLYANGAATGQHRQIQYELMPGEGQKQLVPAKAIEY